MTTTPHLGVELARNGYSAYAEELRALHSTLASFCSTPEGGNPPRCMSCTLEIELSYLRLRMAKPRVVWEISPLHGFTTVMILSALHHNNNSARLHSFDRHAGAKVYVTHAKFPELFRMWSFHERDLIQSVKHTLASHDNDASALFKALAPRPNYLFLDSYHSATMGGLYVDTLLPAMQRYHTHVSLHDVYNPLFWTDDHYERNLTTYPLEMANLEGGMVLDWLAYPHLADACGLFTAAPSKRGNLGFHAEIWQLRAAAGLPRSMRLDPVAERASRADFVCPEPDRKSVV